MCSQTDLSQACAVFASIFIDLAIRCICTLSTAFGPFLLFLLLFPLLLLVTTASGGRDNVARIQQFQQLVFRMQLDFSSLCLERANAAAGLRTTRATAQNTGEKRGYGRGLRLVQRLQLVHQSLQL